MSNNVCLPHPLLLGCAAPACRGVPVVEVNLEATGNSAACRLSIQGKAGLLLPELLNVADDPQVAAAMAEAAAGSCSRAHS